MDREWPHENVTNQEQRQQHMYLELQQHQPTSVWHVARDYPRIVPYILRARQVGVLGRLQQILQSNTYQRGPLGVEHHHSRKLHTPISKVFGEAWPALRNRGPTSGFSRTMPKRRSRVSELVLSNSPDDCARRVP